MSKMKRVFAVVALIAIVIGGSASEAFATPRYAKAKIRNATNMTIHYLFRWGDGPWQSWTVSPNQTAQHAWRYATPGVKKSPRLEVRFDADTTYVDYWQTYNLEKLACPDDSPAYGKRYKFGWDGVGGRYIDLTTD